MIVTCERCSTQFRLADKRVPEQGVRVRCSRCKYAFRVERPASSEDERIRRAAARGLEPDTPEITQDLPDEEEDWEFNDHGPSAEAQGSDAGDAAAESAGEEDGTPLGEAMAASGDAYGFSAGSQSVGTPDGNDDDAPLAPSGLDLGDGPDSFGSGPAPGPFDDADQDDAGSGLDLAGPGDSALGLDPGLAGAGESGGQEPQGPVDAPDALGEMGSPDKWDFFATDSSDRAKPTPRVRMTATPPRASVPRAAPVPRDLLSDEPQLQFHWLEGVVGGVGWIVVAVAFAAGLYGGFASGARESAAAAASQQVADLHIAEVSGRWVDNLVAGDLYVVSGAVRRAPAGGDAADGGLFVTLLDAQGERLRLAPIPVGPPLPQALLRQADPADLHGAGGQAISPELGASLRVEAVIPAPPAAASAFRFVTAGELAASDVPLASPDAGTAAGAILPSEPEVRFEQPNDAP